MVWQQFKNCTFYEINPSIIFCALKSKLRLTFYSVAHLLSLCLDLLLMPLFLYNGLEFFCLLTFKQQCCGNRSLRSNWSEVPIGFLINLSKHYACLHDQSNCRKRFPEHCYPNVNRPKIFLTYSSGVNFQYPFSPKIYRCPILSFYDVLKLLFVQSKDNKKGSVMVHLVL